MPFTFSFLPWIWMCSAEICRSETECRELYAGRSPQSSPARSQATPVRRAPPPSPPSPTTPTRAVTNESLAWELLYDLNFQVTHPFRKCSSLTAAGHSLSSAQLSNPLLPVFV